MHFFASAYERKRLQQPDNGSGNTDLEAEGPHPLVRNQGEGANEKHGNQREERLGGASWKMRELKNARQIDGDGDEKQTGERRGCAQLGGEERVPGLYRVGGHGESAV
jgi:hypothetical protein